MYLIFYKTNDVFLAEEKLLEHNFSVKIVPTPVQDKAYCGVCVEIDECRLDLISAVLTDLEYKTVKRGV